MTAFPSAPAPARTLADALLPRRAAHSLLADFTLIVLFSGFVALSAQIAISLPFTPVPITGQTLGVLLTGAALGRRRGALALLLYLAEGSCGLPVFAQGGLGVAKLVGPTGGYLLSYPIAAALVGFLAERGWDRNPFRALPAMLLAGSVTLLMGTFWLAHFVGGIGPAVAKGVLPFLPGDICKTLLAAGLLPIGWAIVHRIQGTEKP